MARPEKPKEIVRDLLDTAAQAGAETAAPGTATPSRASSAWRALSRHRRIGAWAILASLGPGLIAANAGNDAGGILTYASTGARYGYALLWVLPLMTISLAVVQEMAARMGAATGKGLTDLIRENFSIQVAALIMLALLISNGATVISEFVGIDASVILLKPGLQYLAVPLIALAIWLLVTKGSYRGVERVFLLMTIAFFAYPVAAVLAHPNWGHVFHQTFRISITGGSEYLLILVALIGTTITPYQQVFVQSSVVEKGVTSRDYKPERIGVYGGSIFAVLTAGFIMVATAATLFPRHQLVNTVQDAADALRPLGTHPELIFATGLFGASILAAAVLPLATAYSVSEALGVETGVSKGFNEAPVFMGLFTGLMIVGVLVALIPGLPVVQLLIVTQVINGLLMPVVLFTILKLVNDRRLMAGMANGPIYNVIAWITAIVVSLLSLTLLALTVAGWFGL
ncbi:MAG: Nramp family divalent metal transporter [Chloroflexota bacterium]